MGLFNLFGSGRGGSSALTNQAKTILEDEATTDAEKIELLKELYGINVPDGAIISESGSYLMGSNNNYITGA